MGAGERGVDAASSLHGDALRQVAGKIDRPIQPIGDVVGKQLEVDVREDGFDGRRHVRKCEHVVALRRREDVVGDDSNQGHAAGRRLADVLSDAPGLYGVAGEERKHRRVVRQRGERPVLQIACAEPLRVLGGNLFELQRTLEGDKASKFAAKVEHRVRVNVVLGYNWRVRAVDSASNSARKPQERL